MRAEEEQQVVAVPGADGGEPVTTPFTPGAVGDEYTEVRSGVREGQEVLLPQGRVSSRADRLSRTDAVIDRTGT